MMMDSDRFTWRAENGHVEVVRVLVDAAADVEAQTAAGSRPLYIAAHHGHVEVARTLMEAGADLEAALPPSGERPLHSERERGGGADDVGGWSRCGG